MKRNESLVNYIEVINEQRVDNEIMTHMFSCCTRSLHRNKIISWGTVLSNNISEWSQWLQDICIVHPLPQYLYICYSKYHVYFSWYTRYFHNHFHFMDGYMYNWEICVIDKNLHMNLSNHCLEQGSPNFWAWGPHHIFSHFEAQRNMCGHPHLHPPTRLPARTHRHTCTPARMDVRLPPLACMDWKGTCWIKWQGRL